MIYPLDYCTAVRFLFAWICSLCDNIISRFLVNDKQRGMVFDCVNVLRLWL